MNNKITIEDYRKLQEGQASRKGSKKPKKPPVDYNGICALPCWKAETHFGVTQYALPMPPSANVYWRNIKGKTLVSEDAKNYKKEVAKLAHRLGMRPAKGNVVLTIQVYRNQASGDLSNRIKVVEDALIGVAYADDAQVTEIHAFRYDDKGNGRIVVSIVEV